MKHLIILGDGMADRVSAACGGKTPLQVADTPAFDRIAREGRCGMLITAPAPGVAPGSDVAIASILGYEAEAMPAGRAPLEALGMGYELRPDQLAVRCNLISVDADGRIINHHGGHLSDEEGRELLSFLGDNLPKEGIEWLPGLQYRHLLLIEGGSSRIWCAAPHEHIGKPWRECRVRPLAGASEKEGMSAEETAGLLNSLIGLSQQLLRDHPVNRRRIARGELPANSIWPWSVGHGCRLQPLAQRLPEIGSGAVVSAVDLIRGLGVAAGLAPIMIEGANGRLDTNYEGKVRAVVEALDSYDFVILHFEATDEASHDGDVALKVKAIERLDHRIVAPLLEALSAKPYEVAVALLPDHATPAELRVHTSEPVPFAIRTPGVAPDSVTAFSETSCAAGAYGCLPAGKLLPQLLSI